MRYYELNSAKMAEIQEALNLQKNKNDEDESNIIDEDLELA